MSYTRFENTLADLKDCEDNMCDTKELSKSEKKSRLKMIELCINIAAVYGWEVIHAKEQ